METPIHMTYSPPVYFQLHTVAFSVILNAMHQQQFRKVINLILAIDKYINITANCGSTNIGPNYDAYVGRYAYLCGNENRERIMGKYITTPPAD